MPPLLLLAGLCLSLLPSWVLANGRTMPTPDVAYEALLSPGHPLTIQELLRMPRPVSTLTAGHPTYTYVRCYYRQSADANQPQTRYLWARTADDSDFYRLPGVWRMSAAWPWASMFMSEVSQNALWQTCRQTLATGAGGREPVLVAAANNAMAYNHTVWTFAPFDPPAGLERMVAFGDSLSDTQNMFSMSQWKLPERDTWFLGRFSNAPVWVEHVAKGLGLPLYNWAVGGAAGDRVAVVPGVRQQVASWQYYASTDPGYRPEKTLFTLWIGGNDLITYGRTPEKVIEDVHAALQTLIDRGARQILLLNLPDLSRTPQVQAGGQGARLVRQVDTYNRLLAALVTQLTQQYGSGLTLRLFDTHALFEQVMANPAAFQIDNIQDACLDITPGTMVPYFRRYAPSPACRDAGRYLFWDPLHPSGRTHAVLAERVQAFWRTPANAAATRSSHRSGR